jgi:O-acetyl-ADP-ribose deacetylase
MIQYKGCHHCLHFRPDGSCLAFDPFNIPLSITSGRTRHENPLPDQANEIAYEPTEKSIVYRMNDFRLKNREMREKVKIINGDATQQIVDAMINFTSKELNTPNNGEISTGRSAEEVKPRRNIWEVDSWEIKRDDLIEDANFSAHRIIHISVSVQASDCYSEESLLALYYRSIFDQLKASAVKTVAIPASILQTDAFSIEKASKIAIRELRRFLEISTSLEEIYFVCHEQQVYDLYTESINATFIPV